MGIENAIKNMDDKKTMLLFLLVEVVDITSIPLTNRYTRTGSPMPMQISNILLPYAFEKASLYFSFWASLTDNIVSGMLEATAAIKKVMKNKFIFSRFDSCSLLVTSSLQAKEIITKEITKIKLAFQVFNLDLFNINPIMLILIIFLNNPVSSM